MSSINNTPGYRMFITRMQSPQESESCLLCLLKYPEFYSRTWHLVGVQQILREREVKISLGFFSNQELSYKTSQQRETGRRRHISSQWSKHTSHVPAWLCPGGIRYSYVGVHTRRLLGIQSTHILIFYLYLFKQSVFGLGIKQIFKLRRAGIKFCFHSFH